MKRILSLICMFACFYADATPERPILLIKMPTRSRPQQFFKNLETFYKQLSYKIPYLFLITCDIDDESMNNPLVRQRFESYPNLAFTFSANNSKIDAANKDINDYDFDILLAVHDDMQAIVKGFDEIIVNNMLKRFPDLDGVLNFNDGFVGGQCNILPVIGKKFYDRFGYLYNPEYKANVCNLELTNISKMLRKELIINQVIIRHNHPAHGSGYQDDLYTKNERYHAQDFELFLKRRSYQFDLPNELLIKTAPKLWSILICTIEGREESFNCLCTKLRNQIRALGLHNEIEILSCKDKRGEHSIGFKRNQLMEISSGFYTQFLDDDDDIHDNFIAMIYEKLQKRPDCVSLVGIITTNGVNPKTFIHSIAYDEYSEAKNIYFRPPNHLNPIKRSIAIQFTFPEKNFGEDTDWAMDIARSKLIKTEETIETPYYFYRYDATK